MAISAWILDATDALSFTLNAPHALSTRASRASFAEGSLKCNIAVIRTCCSSMSVIASCGRKAATWWKNKGTLDCQAGTKQRWPHTGTPAHPPTGSWQHLSDDDVHHKSPDILAAATTPDIQPLTGARHRHCSDPLHRPTSFKGRLQSVARAYTARRCVRVRLWCRRPLCAYGPYILCNATATQLHAPKCFPHPLAPSVIRH